MKPQHLKDYLKAKLTAKELEHLTASFDIVGNIAIIEIRKELLAKEKIIGEAILKMHKNIVTVCRRDGIHSGKFRTQKLRIIAGKRSKETVHRESGCVLKLHVEKCYYSVRSGSERLRIVDLIKQRDKVTGKKEDILVMFSGVAPYICVIGKNAPYKSLTSIELNKIAHTYAQDNVLKNKIANVTLINGDVKKVKLKHKFDRIIMPLPKSAEDFLPYAFPAAKKGTIIHLYTFLLLEESLAYAQKIVTESGRKGYRLKVIEIVKCGQFSPRTFRICVDLEVM